MQADTKIKKSTENSFVIRALMQFERRSLYSVVFVNVPFVVVDTAEGLDHLVEVFFGRLGQNEGSGDLNVIFAGDRNDIVQAVELLAEIVIYALVVVIVAEVPEELASAVFAEEFRLEKFTCAVHVTEDLFGSALRQKHIYSCPVLLV